MGDLLCLGGQVDLARIQVPESFDLLDWLKVYPSYGFLLVCKPERKAATLRRFEERGIWADGIGRTDDSGQLRLRVVDYQLVRPGALMPSYYRIHNLHQVGTAYEGETILSAQDIEDIVAYLGAQKVGDDDGS